MPLLLLPLNVSMMSVGLDGAGASSSLAIPFRYGRASYTRVVDMQTTTTT